MHDVTVTECGSGLRERSTVELAARPYFCRLYTEARAEKIIILSNINIAVVTCRVPGAAPTGGGAQRPNRERKHGIRTQPVQCCYIRTCDDAQVAPSYSICAHTWACTVHAAGTAYMCMYM